MSSQCAVVGPVVFGAILLGFWRFWQAPFLAALCLPALTLVTLQSILQVSNANWAASSYFAGSVLAVIMLSQHRGWCLLALAINGAVCLALPMLTLFPTLALGPAPLLNRYIGRAEVSRHILVLAHQHGAVAVVSHNRDVMADLFYSGRGDGLPFYTPRPSQAAMNFYEQTYPVPVELIGPVLLISDQPPACAALLVQPDLKATAYCHHPIAAYIVPAACARDLPAGPGCK